MSLNTPIPVPVPGKSLVASRTFWSLVGAVLTYILPGLLSHFGISPDQAGPVVDAICQDGPVLLPMLAVVFHAVSSRPVTSVLPKSAQPARLMSILAVLVLVVFVAPVLSACGGAAGAGLIPPSAEVQVAQGVSSLDLLYNTAGNAYLKDLATMDPTLKATVKPLLQEALPLVRAVDAAEKAGTATSPETITADTAQAIALIGQAKDALGVK